MSAVAQFPLHARAMNKPNLARAMDSYDKGYNAAIAVVVPEIKRQRRAGFSLGVTLGIAFGSAFGVVLAVLVGGWLA